MQVVEAAPGAALFLFEGSMGLLDYFKRKKDSKGNKLQEVFDQMETRTTLDFCRFEGTGTFDEAMGVEIPKRLTVCFSFSEKGFGFGEVVLVVDEKGRAFVDGETMSRDHVKRIIGALIDNAIMDTDEDPERHKLFDKVMHRSCGSPECPTNVEENTPCYNCDNKGYVETGNNDLPCESCFRGRTAVFSSGKTGEEVLNTYNPPYNERWPRAWGER
jgi:hypothetical protein